VIFFLREFSSCGNALRREKAVQLTHRPGKNTLWAPFLLFSLSSFLLSVLLHSLLTSRNLIPLKMLSAVRRVASANPASLMRPLTSMTMTSSFSTSSSTYAPINVKNITVFGSGLMGAGIVQVAAQNAFNVTMVDLNPEALKKGQDIITSSLKRIAKKQFPEDAEKQKEFIDTTMAQIKTSTDSEAASKDADLIIEAIVENLKTKQQLFSMLDKIAPEHTLFCSNTSSLPIEEIAKSTKRADRFGGLHFFNPVPQMKLVEVIRTEATSQDSFDSLMDVCKRMKKTPVSCKDTPG